MMRHVCIAMLLLPMLGLAASADDAGYLGVILGPPQPGETKGALIQEIFQDSPADRDGLRSGDLIVAVNDQDVADAQGLLNAVKDLKSGDKARYKVQRVGEEGLKEVAVTLGGRPEKPFTEIPLKKRALLGIAFSVQPDGSLMVAKFLPGSTAQEAGMQTGDIVNSIAGHETKAYAAVLSSLAAQKDGAEVKIKITRNGQPQELTARVKEAALKYQPKQAS